LGVVGIAGLTASSGVDEVDVPRHQIAEKP
jgi:hypothetical protein